MLDTFVGGPTGLGDGAVDGMYFDDGWVDQPGPAYAKSCSSCSCSSIGGPTEVEGHCMNDMGLSQQAVTEITEGWKQTQTALATTLKQHQAFSWQDLRDSSGFGRNYSGGLEGCKSSCAAFLRESCAGSPDTTAVPPIQRAPLLYQFSGTDHVTDGFNNHLDAPVALKQDIAMFLLVRGAYAFLGTAWMGPCPWTAGDCQGQQ